MRYVSLDGVDYGKKLISEGYAHLYNFHSQPHALSAAYQAVQDEAQRAGRGFWNKDTCAGDTLKPGIFLQSATYRAVVPTTTPPSCQGFKSVEDAQRFYEANGGPFEDKYGLDPKRNGRACTELL